MTTTDVITCPVIIITPPEGERKRKRSSEDCADESGPLEKIQRLEEASEKTATTGVITKVVATEGDIKVVSENSEINISLSGGAMPVSETSEINIDLSSEKVSLLDGASEEMTTTDVNCDGAPVILPDNRWCDASVRDF
ncbi:hypothetical protein ACROYT_G009527 [Oculina patagonica]